jgi:hypothetical protein
MNGPVHLNLKVHYLYRDANNYKNHGEIILTGIPKSIPAWEKSLKNHLEEHVHFIASQINVPEVFHFKKDWPLDPESDHCWHEFTYTEETREEPTDNRTPQEFLSQVKEESSKGWKIFQPT